MASSAEDRQNDYRQMMNVTNLATARFPVLMESCLRLSITH
jgi:hypothetical protein